MVAFYIKMFEIKWGSIVVGSGDREGHSNNCEQRKQNMHKIQNALVCMTTHLLLKPIQKWRGLYSTSCLTLIKRFRDVHL